MCRQREQEADLRGPVGRPRGEPQSVVELEVGVAAEVPLRLGDQREFVRGTLDARVEAPAGRDALQVFECELPDVVVAVGNLLVNDREARGHGAPREAAYGAHPQLQLTARRSGQDLLLAARYHVLSVAEQLLTPLGLLLPPPAQLSLDVPEAVFVDSGRDRRGIRW